MRIIKKDPTGATSAFGLSDVTVGLLDGLATKTLRGLQDFLAERRAGVGTAQRDAVVAKAEWRFPSSSDGKVCVGFNLLEDIVEFPILPGMEAYGSPGRDVGYEKERRNTHDLVWEFGRYPGGADRFVEFSIFVVKRESGETSPLLSSAGSSKCVGRRETKDGVLGISV